MEVRGQRPELDSRRVAARDGVDYEAVAARARALGVMGWVRPTGEIHAEGRADAVAELLRGLDTTPAKVEGHEQFGIRGVPAGPFAVRATDRGYVLGLEVDGEMRWWALPKEPSMDPSVKRFAVPTDGGEGEVWDAGTYEQGGRVAWPEALDRGHAVFVLHGSKLQGGFALQRVARGWLLVKRRPASPT